MVLMFGWKSESILDGHSKQIVGRVETDNIEVCIKQVTWSALKEIRLSDNLAIIGKITCCF